MSNFNAQKPLNIVAVSGGLNHPSKTEALVQAILYELGEATPINVHFIKFSEILNNLMIFSKCSKIHPFR